ncbi:MAG: zinc metallopeptidase [Chloroflexi bacterium]|nr:zinc metallopeptidase [Chloroflexota bacterium]
MFFDPSYIVLVLIPTLLLSLGAQLFVRSAYNRWGQTRNSSGLTGVQVAERIFGRTNVNSLRLEQAPGELTDHYDPGSHVVRLSEGIATRPSVASMAVVAHELGHVQQHQENSALIQMRTFLVPAVRFSPTIGYFMIILGLLLNATGLFWAGILLFGLMVVFMILTLPVEIDASLRGLRLLRESDLLVAETDTSGSRQILTAAAITYFAAAITAVLQLLYFISLSRR